MRIFGENGLLSKKLKGYRHREPQEDLAKYVNYGMKNNCHVIVEAPTGVGKSQGALIPVAIRHRNEEDRTILICTATIALQEQYFKKELPFITEILGFKNLSFSLIKGMSNFICLLKADQIMRERVNPAVQVLKEFLGNTQIGDFSELEAGQVLMLNSLNIRCEMDECLHTKCPKYSECFYFRNRDSAQSANVIISNYHYFLSHMKLVLLKGTYILLPQLDSIIFDEAHIISELTRDFFAYDISSRSMVGISKFLEHRYPDTAFLFNKYQSEFFSMLDSHLGGVPIRLIYDLNQKFYSDRSANFLGLLAQAKTKIDSEIRNMSIAIGKEPANVRGLLGARKLAKQCSNISSLVSEILRYLDDSSSAANSNQVIWVDRDRDMNIRLSVKPIMIDTIFSKGLMAITPQANFMSATLDPMHLIKSIGLQNTKTKIIKKRLPSVFNFKEQAALYIPNLGDPNSAEFDTNVAKFLQDLAIMMGGGILALFTSYKALDVAKERLDSLPDGTLKNPLIWQDRIRSNDQLAKEFLKGDRVLLGTKSFMQGVDFYGNVAKVVLINKIPFKEMNDPVILGMKHFGAKDWFQQEQLSHAKLLFAQATGRLIRRETDTGIIVCPDYRLISKSYGEIILSGLPKGLPILTEWDEFVIKLEKVCK